MDLGNESKIKWIVNLRWVAVASQLTVLPFAIRYDYIKPQNVSFYLLLVLLLFIFNIFSFKKKLRLLTESISIQSIIDLFIFTGLILLSGKMENPFWSLIYMHAGMSAILIEPRKDLHFLPFLLSSMAIVHILSIEYYSSLIFIIIPQWIILICIYSLMRGIGLLLLKQQQTIQRLTHKELNSQKLKSVGLLSSGILHEIGTPLNTIRLKVNRLLSKGAKHFNERDISVLDKSLSSVEDVLSKLNQAQYESENKIIQNFQWSSVCNPVAPLM